MLRREESNKTQSFGSIPSVWYSFRNGFSITLLVSLLFDSMFVSENEHSRCEMQFEYGLRGKRGRPFRERPKSFTSAFGKEIRIDSIVGAQNDVITRKGKVSRHTTQSCFSQTSFIQAIHKSLEREVKPQEVIVQVTSIEERWALRQVRRSCFTNIFIYR